MAARGQDQTGVVDLPTPPWRCGVVAMHFDVDFEHIAANRAATRLDRPVGQRQPSYDARQ